MSSVTLNLRTQKGFTLIELVIVIVIIGILAAVALPKFASLQADARIGAMKGATGALQTANVAVYSAAQIQNKVSDATTGPNVCGTAATPITVPTQNGFAVDLDGLAKCVSLGTEFIVSGTTLTYSTFTDCKMSYTAAASGGAPIYNITALTTANCS